MDNNVYQAPASDITTHESDATQPVKLFNTKGGMGRIRYMFYTVALPMVIAILAAIAIPVYQDYVERSKAAQISSQG